jgi:UDP-glucose 4-epimerase
MGSYTIRKEINGSYVHVLDLVQMHPSAVEYADGGSGSTAGTVGTQDVNFAMDFAGDHYRIIKTTSAQLNVAAMRRTAGMPYTTP